MKKKIIVFILILLTSCKAGVDDQNHNIPFFLFAIPLNNHPVWSEASNGFLDACNELKIYCEVKGPETIDTQTMENIIYEGIMKKADGIITQGVVSEDILILAKKKNIPVILVDSDVKDAPKSSIIRKEFNDQANIIVKDIIEVLPNTSYKIAIQVAEYGFEIAPKQIEALEKSLLQHNLNFEIVSITESKSDSLLAYIEWVDTLTNHPEINVLVNFAGESASEAAKAVDMIYTNQKRPLIYGVDEAVSTIQAIKEKRIRGTIVTSFYNYGYESVEMLFDFTKNNVPIVDIKYVDIYLLTEVEE